MVNTLHPPPEVIMSWPKANYTNPPDSGPALFIVIILLSVITFFLVSARVYSRVFLTRAPGSDDVLIVLGTLLTIGLSTLVAIGNKRYYAGRHIWDVPVTSFAGHRLVIWVSEWFYLAAAACIKISILLFYRRLSVSFSRKFLIATWIGIIYNIMVWFGFVICLVTLCRPIKAYWKAYDFMWAAGQKFRCDTEQVTLPLSGALSVVGDLYATLLPLFMIKSTNRSAKQKMALYSLFGLGFVSVAAGIVRTIMMNKLINVDYDLLIPLYWMWMNTIIELYLAIIAASAPALKPFFKKFVVMPVSMKTKSSGDRSTTAKSPGPWNPDAPWSQGGSHRGSVNTIDIEKVGIAHAFPERIKPDVHTTWVELQRPDTRDEEYEMQDRRYSRMVSFPEERTPSINEIAIAR